MKKSTLRDMTYSVHLTSPSNLFFLPCPKKKTNKFWVWIINKQCLCLLTFIIIVHYKMSSFVFFLFQVMNVCGFHWIKNYLIKRYLNVIHHLLFFTLLSGKFISINENIRLIVFFFIRFVFKSFLWLQNATTVMLFFLSTRYSIYRVWEKKDWISNKNLFLNREWSIRMIIQYFN
jgi:hypothetical protein